MAGSAFDAWSAQQKAMGGTGNYGDAPVYGTNSYNGMNPSLYAALAPVDNSAPQAPSAGGSIGGGNGTMVTGNPTLVGGVAYYGNAPSTTPVAGNPAGQGASLGSMSTQPYQMTSSSGLGSMQSASPSGFGGMNSSYNSTAPNSASMGGMGGSNGMGSSNPYLQQQITALQNSSNQNLRQNVLPSINSGAMAAGQYGGSRQGAAQGMAIGNAQTGLDAATAGLLSGNYQFDQNLGLGYQNSNNQYNLGMGALDNQATGLNQSFYGQQRGQDFQQLQLGANLFGQGVSGNAGLGQGIYGTGQQAYNAGQGALDHYGNGVAQMAGFGGSQTQTGSNSTLANVAGGAVVGDYFGNRLGSLWNPNPVNIGNASYTPDQGANFFGGGGPR